MTQLEESDPKVWKFMQDGNFSVNKNQIPFTALERGHDREQETKF